MICLLNTNLKKPRKLRRSNKLYHGYAPILSLITDQWLIKLKRVDSGSMGSVSRTLTEKGVFYNGRGKEKPVFL